jgi:TRAP-type C4-dicarboxylate transport system substrate-binding protein
MGVTMRVTTAVLLLWASLACAAEPRTLRIASVVPEGTSWARELHALAREVESATGGQLKIKLYLSGVAGDEMDELARVRRDQLDGVLSAGMLCQELAPSFRVVRVPGMFQSREENAYVLSQLKPVLDKEFLDAGFVHLGDAGVGPSIIFSRMPIANMAELRRHPLWIWDLDSTLKAYLGAIGMSPQPSPIYLASKRYEEQRIDGFITAPTAALGFQWSAQVKYFTELHLSYVSGCFLVSSRAFDALPQEHRVLLREATAKTQRRIEARGREMDQALVGGLFRKQGLTEVHVDDRFRNEFMDAAIEARKHLAGKLLPQALVDRVLVMLADFRASR